MYILSHTFQRYNINNNVEYDIYEREITLRNEIQDYIIYTEKKNIIKSRFDRSKII